MVLRLRDKIFPVRSLKSAINASTDWDICLLNSSLFMEVEACSLRHYEGNFHKTYSMLANLSSFCFLLYLRYSYAPLLILMG